jgi:hypothetical protein
MTKTCEMLASLLVAALRNPRFKLASAPQAFYGGARD